MALKKWSIKAIMSYPEKEISNFIFTFCTTNLAQKCDNNVENYGLKVILQLMEVPIFYFEYVFDGTRSVKYWC